MQTKGLHKKLKYNSENGRTYLQIIYPDYIKNNHILAIKKTTNSINEWAKDLYRHSEEDTQMGNNYMKRYQWHQKN